MWEVLWSIEASAIDSHPLLLLLLQPNSIKTADECWWVQMGLHNFDIIMISSMQCELQQHENGYDSEPNMIVSCIQYGDMGCVFLDLTKLRKCSTSYNKEPKIFQALKFVSMSRFFQKCTKLKRSYFVNSLESMLAGNEAMLPLSMSLKSRQGGCIFCTGLLSGK